MKASVTHFILTFVITCSSCLAQSAALEIAAIKATVIKSAATDFFNVGDQNEPLDISHRNLITSLFTLFARSNIRGSNMVRISGEPGETISIALSRSPINGISRQLDNTSQKIDKRPFFADKNVDAAFLSTKLDIKGESLVALGSLVALINKVSSWGEDAFTIVISY
ncbi:MAG: hypothetical protein ACP5MI_09570 [Candidatus Kryptoniota bacterium]